MQGQSEKADKEIWDSLSEYDKWVSFRDTYNAYQDMKDLYNKSIDRENILISDLEKTTKLLKNKWYPKFGFNINLQAGLDQRLNIDVYTNLNFLKYFLEGRAFFLFGGGIKFYNAIGGDINIGIGFNF